MPTLSSAGIGSGLDVAGLVTKLIDAEKRPLQLLQMRASTANGKLSAYGKVKAQLDLLRTASSDIATVTNWSAKSASLANAAIASVSASASSTVGEYNVEVTHLAQSQRLVAAAVPDTSALMGTGTITLGVGKWNGSTFEPSAGATPVTITVDATNNSLGGIRDAINAAGTAVRASVVTDTSGARLVLTSTATGTASALQVSVVDDDGTPTDSAGLSRLAYNGDTTASAPGLRQAQPAQDARILLDGIEVLSSTNTVSGAIDGVTFTLRGTNTDSPTTLKVSHNTGNARAMVDKFVGAYNAAVTMLADLTKADPGGTASGALQGDAAARSLANSLRSLVTRMVPSGTLSTLAQAGIALGKDGKLAVDGTRFDATIASGTADLQSFFTATSGDEAAQGIAVRFKSALDSILGSDGTISARTTGLDNTIKANKRDQDRQTARLAAMELRLKKQYGALDTMISTMSTMSSTLSQNLTQIAAISSASNGNN